MVKIQLAESIEHLQGILDLQKQNTKSVLASQEQDKEGFVTVQHSLELLAKMQRLNPHIIALYDDKVIGYAISMDKSCSSDIEVLIPMFDRIDNNIYRGVPLSDVSYYVMGQICIDKAYRQKGLFRKLYDSHKGFYSTKFQYCITEVSDRNQRSLSAHLHTGFQIIESFRDQTDDWHLLLWDWS